MMRSKGLDKLELPKEEGSGGERERERERERLYRSRTQFCSLELHRSASSKRELMNNQQQAKNEEKIIIRCSVFDFIASLSVPLTGGGSSRRRSALVQRSSALEIFVPSAIAEAGEMIITYPNVNDEGEDVNDEGEKDR